MNRSASLGIASNTIAPPNASEEDRIGIHPEDRWDLPFLPPLATFEGAQDISEGRFDSVFGVEVDSLRSLIPLPSASPAITTPTSFPSNMDHRKMRELLDEPIPVHMSSCPSPSNLSPSSSASSGSPESRLSSSEEFYPAPGYSFSYDPTLGDSTYAPLHSFSVLTMQPGWTIGADISGYDHPSFTEPTVNPKLVVVSPPIENSDDSTEEEDEDEDEDEEMHVPASALIKKKPTKKPTPLSPTKTKRTNNTTKGRANTMTKVKAAAKKAHKKNSRGVWRPPPSLPKCCAKCKSSSALSRHKTTKDHFAHFPHERLTALKFWCPITACRKSRQNAPDIEAAFYRDQSLCRHLENVHGLEHDLEYVQSLGTID